MQSIMGCLNAFVLLFLVFQLEQSASMVITGSIGDSVQFEDSTIRPRNSRLSQCNVEHDGISYSIFPMSNLSNAEWESFKMVKDCTFWLHNIKLDDAGEWTIQSIWETDDGSVADVSETIYFYIAKKQTSLPREFIAEVGHYVTVSLEPEPKNLTSCTLMHYKADSSTERGDILNTPQLPAGLERYEQCGIRIFVNESSYGKWVIRQTYGPYIIITLEFEIKKLADVEIVDETDISWLRGAPAEIKLSQSSKFLYCKIINPNGRSTIIENDFCALQITEVNWSHNGIWEIHYLLPGNMNFIKKNYTVRVGDSVKSYKVNVRTNTTSYAKKHLLCTTSGIASEFCLFTQPGGGATVILSEGIGNRNFEYYGQGYQYKKGQTTYSDCGLTINYPDPEDYGLWECSFGKVADPRKAYVSLYDPEKTKKRAYVRKEVHAKRGDTFTVECPRLTPLTSCYLRHEAVNTGRYMTFAGKNEGLADGICQAEISNADTEHEDGWGCYLNTVEGTLVTVRSAIWVYVHDEYVYTNPESILYIGKYRTPTLTCNLFPQSYDTVSYCRWEHDNNERYEVGNTTDFEVSLDKKSCSIEMKTAIDQRWGVWTCYIKVRKAETGVFSDEEESTSIIVSERYENDYYRK